MPPALLFTALGLALAPAPRSIKVVSLLSLIAITAALAIAPVFDALPTDGVFLGCWISVVATAASVYLIRGLRLGAAIALSLNAGVWASAVLFISGSQSAVLEALPCVLIVLPASWVAARYSSIPIKVVSSWVIAVAVLAATLQWLPVTPGYLPDHME